MNFKQWLKENLDQLFLLICTIVVILLTLKGAGMI